MPVLSQLSYKEVHKWSRGALALRVPLNAIDWVVLGLYGVHILLSVFVHRRRQDIVESAQMEIVHKVLWGNSIFVIIGGGVVVFQIVQIALGKGAKQARPPA